MSVLHVVRGGERRRLRRLTANFTLALLRNTRYLVIIVIPTNIKHTQILTHPCLGAVPGRSSSTAMMYSLSPDDNATGAIEDAEGTTLSPTADEVQGHTLPLVEMINRGDIEPPDHPLSWVEWTQVARSCRLAPEASQCFLGS